jgi:hypothetical protein
MTADHCCSCNSCNAIQDTSKDYYICECTTCRNLGNSMDICCQCCSCSTAASSEYGPRYHVASMALTGDTEDTLEVCLQQQSDVLDHHEPVGVEDDDIALAHSLADHHQQPQQQQHGSCHECQSCCSSAAQPHQPRKPVFPGWQTHNQPQVARRLQQQQQQQQRQLHSCGKGKGKTIARSKLSNCHKVRFRHCSLFRVACKQRSGQLIFTIISLRNGI